MNLSHLVLALFITFHKTLFAFVLFSGRGRGVIRSGISRVFPATMQKAAEVLDNFGVAYEKKVVSENLIAMKRAGADIIITYHALDAAKWIDEFYK